MVAFNELKMNPDDTPPPDVLNWCANLVRTIKDGGVWGIPRSKTTFRLDKANKRLVLIEPGNDDYSDFYATKHAFKFIGWDVVTVDEVDNAKKDAEPE
jgi:hypothetical protein